MAVRDTTTKYDPVEKKLVWGNNLDSVINGIAADADGTNLIADAFINYRQRTDELNQDGEDKTNETLLKNYLDILQGDYNRKSGEYPLALEKLFGGQLNLFHVSRVSDLMNKLGVDMNAANNMLIEEFENGCRVMEPGPLENYLDESIINTYH